MTPNNLYLKPEEGKFLSMSVVTMLEDLQATLQDVQINWTPQSRKEIKDMLAAGNNLKEKLQKLGFDMRDLPPFLNGDENEFLTKQS